jgi:hypothetical protein
MTNQSLLRKKLADQALDPYAAPNMTAAPLHRGPTRRPRERGPGAAGGIGRRRVGVPAGSREAEALGVIFTAIGRAAPDLAPGVPPGCVPEPGE